MGLWGILTPLPERRIHPAGRRAALGLPDESGVPIGMAARIGGGVRMRPVFGIQGAPAGLPQALDSDQVW